MGDRVFTDVVMANRMRGGIGLKGMTSNEFYQSNGPLAIWTTDIWEKDAMGVRWLERKLVQVVQRWTKDAKGDGPDTTRFVKKFVEAEPSSTGGMVAGLFRRFRRN